MKTVSATEAKNRFGEHFDFGDQESLLIESHGSPSHLAFTAATGRRLVLIAFSTGGISRDQAMSLLGFEWYGQLLDALAAHGIDRPDAHLSADDRAALERARPLLEEILE
jgi:hypothetical protein